MSPTREIEISTYKHTCLKVKSEFRPRILTIRTKKRKWRRLRRSFQFLPSQDKRRKLGRRRESMCVLSMIMMMKEEEDRKK